MPVVFKTTKIAQRAQSDPLLYEMLRDIGTTFESVKSWILEVFAERVRGTIGYVAKFDTANSITDSRILDTVGEFGAGVAPGISVRYVDASIENTPNYVALVTYWDAAASRAVVVPFAYAPPTTTLTGLRLESQGRTYAQLDPLQIRLGTNKVDAVVVDQRQDVQFVGGLYGFRSKTLTEGAATSFADISIGAGEYVAGECLWAVYATDATDLQMRTGRFRFVAVNKAGTITTVSPATEIGTPDVAVSAGTLTVANTVAVGASKITLQSNATSSLVQTALGLRYRVDLLTTAAIITPL